MSCTMLGGSSRSQDNSREVDRLAVELGQFSAAQTFKFRKRRRYWPMKITSGGDNSSRGQGVAVASDGCSSDMDLTSTFHLSPPTIQARLPWIPTDPSSRRHYRETLQFAMSTAQNQKVLSQLQQLFAISHPFHLPARYHSMNCVALLKNSLANECEYLSNATQFVIFNQIYGTSFWSYIDAMAKKMEKESAGKFNLTRLYLHDKQRQAELFGGDKLHMCQTAAEFLLEPWVLIQLPWHPVLLIQWLVAALSEIHASMKEMMEFQCWPTPRPLQQMVKELHEIVGTLDSRVKSGFALVSWLVKDYPVIRPALAKTILNEIILPLIPKLDFVVSKKAESLAKALKQHAWPLRDQPSDEGISDETYFPKSNPDKVLCNIFFTMNADQCKELFGETRESFEEEIEDIIGLELEDTCEFITHANAMDKLNEKCAEEELEKKVVKRDTQRLDSFLESVRLNLKGKIDLELIEGVERLSSIEYSCHILDIVNEDFMAGIIPEETNTIFNIKALCADLYATMAHAAYIGNLYAVLKKKGSQVFLCATNADNPNDAIEIEEIRHTISEVKSSRWTLEELEAQFPQACKEGIKLEEKCPDVSVLGPKKTMKMLELRIKKLVFNMFKESSSTGVQQEIFYPDWQFIQYILPGFVSLIGNFAKNPNIKLTTYLRFVHHLIQSFELHPLTEKLPQEKQEDASVSWSTEAATDSIKRKIFLVQEDLGLLVQEPHTKLPGPVDTALESLLFGQMLDPLSKFEPSKLKSGMSIYVRHLHNCISRIQEAVRIEKLAQCNSDDQKNTLHVLFLAQDLITISKMCTQKVDQTIELLHDHADRKIKTMMGQHPAPPKRDTRPDKRRVAEMRQLSVHQELGIIFFSLASCLDQLPMEMINSFRQPWTYQPALLEMAMQSICSKDWRALKSLLSSLVVDRNGTNPFEVTLDFALTKAYRFYGSILKEMKMLFASPQPQDLLHLAPIKFCRSCDALGGPLKMCSICEDNKDFPDIHWFCSDKCEKLSLEQGHFNDHDHFMMVSCGLFDK